MLVPAAWHLLGLRPLILFLFKFVLVQNHEKHQFPEKARRGTRCVQYIMEILYANGMKENKSGLIAYELFTLKRGLSEGTRLVLFIFIY